MNGNGEAGGLQPGDMKRPCGDDSQRRAAAYDLSANAE